MFCPNCGSLMLPKRIGKKTVLVCSRCGYRSDDTSIAIRKEVLNNSKEIDIIDKEFESNPITEVKCPKCGNNQAYFWTKQTRSADEAETKFFKCTKCGHVWRDYS